MKNLYLVLCLLFLSVYNLNAQCPPSHVVLTSQQEVNDFAANYPNCTRINGDLWIWSPDYFVNTNISDLTPLNQLETIEGSLEIRRNGPLTDMTGLENLDSIGVDLIIKDNPSLTNLSGLQNLVHVGEELRVDNCDNIKVLTGLESITRVDRLIVIFNNKLDSLTGLDQLERVEVQTWIGSNGIVSLAGLENLEYAGSMYLENLPKLEDFSALSGLDTVSDLTIDDVDKPTDLQGLENIISISERLTISNNLRLQNLDALSNLNTLGGYVSLLDNANLTSIESLSDINPSSITHLNIQDNPKLTVCHIESVCTYLFDGGANTINNNKAGCMNTLEVLDACIVSSEDTDALPIIYIAPNPSKGIFQVNGIPQGTYQIRDTAGRVVQSRELQNGFLIDISNEAQGVYFISIQIENETITKKIIKI